MRTTRHGLTRIAGGAVELLWKPDLLHTVYLGVIDNAFDWATLFLDAEGLTSDFDLQWVNLPSYHNWTPPNKPFQAVQKWTGKEMRRWSKALLVVFSVVLKAALDPSGPHRDRIAKAGGIGGAKDRYKQAIRCLRGLIQFSLMGLYPSHTPSTLEYMEKYLNDFHDNKSVFLEFRVTAGIKKKAEKVRMRLRGAFARATDYPADTEEEIRAYRLTPEEKIEIESAVEEFSLGLAHFNYPKIHYLTHFTKYIQKFGPLND